MLPALQKSRSDGMLVAGTGKYFLLSFNKSGYVVW